MWKIMVNENGTWQDAVKLSGNLVLSSEIINIQFFCREATEDLSAAEKSM